ncbi:MFS transporter [Streptomyces griseoloalbus]|uniref:DHA2 family multidrug resistance protein-like MFS transporter n=1 Tax=Streptomyces griseoloalbus TaxID=67303 RepID=A0A7W8BQD6_9ACTN|nr:MFS transporter [Streptomyces albaduncus]MBB5127675.1 DHA2 family multidrug resistance protein-like MFS transporter [Streptomyces albaduncus]GGW62047.1 MFS transporter [Streptomyces albaduncus]
MVSREASVSERASKKAPQRPSEDSTGQRWLVLAVVSGSLLLCGIDLTVLHVAVPSMNRDLQPSAAQLLWIVDVYSLALAALLVTCGTLGDRIGRRRMVLSGFFTFGLASAACAFSTSTAQLIASRAALGAGAAMIMASTVAIIRVVFTDDRERAFAIGVWTSAHSVGATIGPLVGGLVTERWGWGAVFLVNVPVILVILAVGARVIPESRNPVPRRWDLVGVVLSVAGLAGVVYALKQAGEHAGVNAAVLVTAVGGTALLYAFVRRQRRLAEPLLDFSLFGERRFSTATLCVIGCFGSYVALLFFLTQWLQQVGGYSPLHAGLSLMPLAAANAVGAITAPWAANRWGNRWALTGALSLFAAAFAAIAVVGDTAHYGMLLLPLLGAGYGAGIVMTLGADSIMSAAQPERSGEAAAIQETSFELGAGLGVAVLGTVLTAVYRTGLPAVPGLGPDERATAEESFAAAEDLVTQLPSHTADAVLHATQQAYDRGFTAVALIASAGLVVTAFMAAVLLRPREAGKRAVED